VSRNFNRVLQGGIRDEEVYRGPKIIIFSCFKPFLFDSVAKFVVEYLCKSSFTAKKNT